MAAHPRSPQRNGTRMDRAVSSPAHANGINDPAKWAVGGGRKGGSNGRSTWVARQLKFYALKQHARFWASTGGYCFSTTIWIEYMHAIQQARVNSSVRVTRLGLTHQLGVRV